MILEVNLSTNMPSKSAIHMSTVYHHLAEIKIWQFHIHSSAQWKDTEYCYRTIYSQQSHTEKGVQLCTYTYQLHTPTQIPTRHAAKTPETHGKCVYTRHMSSDCYLALTNRVSNSVHDEYDIKLSSHSWLRKSTNLLQYGTTQHCCQFSFYTEIFKFILFQNLIINEWTEYTQRMAEYSHTCLLYTSRCV